MPEDLVFRVKPYQLILGVIGIIAAFFGVSWWGNQLAIGETQESVRYLRGEVANAHKSQGELTELFRSADRGLVEDIHATRVIAEKNGALLNSLVEEMKGLSLVAKVRSKLDGVHMSRHDFGEVVDAMKRLAEASAVRPELARRFQHHVECGACLSVATIIDCPTLGAPEFRVIYKPEKWLNDLVLTAIAEHPESNGISAGALHDGPPLLEAETTL